MPSLTLKLESLGDYLHLGSVVFGLVCESIPGRMLLCIQVHCWLIYGSVSPITNAWVQFVVYFLGKVTRNLYFHPLSKYPGPRIFAATGLVNTCLLIQGKRVYKVAELHDKFGPVGFCFLLNFYQKR
jgi:hypothetical protein